MIEADKEGKQVKDCYKWCKAATESEVSLNITLNNVIVLTARPLHDRRHIQHAILLIHSLRDVITLID